MYYPTRMMGIPTKMRNSSRTGSVSACGKGGKIEPGRGIEYSFRSLKFWGRQNMNT